MAETLYPVTDYDRGTQLLRQLGSYWTNIFGDSEILREHLRGMGHVHGQTYLNTLETLACISRLNIPVFHTENWYLLTALQSDSTALASVYQADDLVYGPQPGTVPGRPAGFTQTYGGQDKPGVVEIALPEDMADAPATLQNYIVYPSKVWVNGIDYTVDMDKKRIRFREDPFTDPLSVRKQVVDQYGNVTDQSVALWVYHGQFDLQYVYKHFAQALDLAVSSTEYGKQALNALYDMFILGPSVTALQAYLSALAGSPLAVGPTETVEYVQEEPGYKVVITDTQVYRFPDTATILVAVGDTLTAGQAISDAVQVAETAGDAVDYSLAPAIALSRNFLGGDYMSELTFKNHRVTLDYQGLDTDDKAVVTFEVHGFPADVELFWELAQARGKTTGNSTLAEMLDTRTDPVGQPGPLNLPATINPLEFIFDNVLRNNMFIIKISLASFPSDAPGVAILRNLRDVIPPHTTYVIFIDITPTLETVDLESTGGENEAGVEEEAGHFSGASAEDEDLYEVDTAPLGAASYGDAAVSARLVSLTCP